MKHVTQQTAIRMRQILGGTLLACLATACLSDAPDGIAKARPAATTVKLDFFHRPLPEIPLPNDIATRYDESSATGRRINASMIAPTGFEQRVRRKIDELDGWGVFQPITIPFTGPLDVESILEGHRDVDYDTANDVIYLIDVDRDSPDFGRVHPLDVGNGNFPVVLEDIDGYWDNDPRGWTISILFDETDEDTNGNGELDGGEDTDADGVLDRPNYLPGHSPDRDDFAARADALMTFYERETNTLIVRPMVPLRERTTYAVVVTRRLLDEDGEPVGSPYDYVNHAAQTHALTPLKDALPDGLALGDVAFAFAFTTQSVESHWIAVREGLYGHGIQKHLGEDYPAEISELAVARDPENPRWADVGNPYILPTEDWAPALQLIAEGLLGQDGDSAEGRALIESQRYIDYQVEGAFESPQLFPRTASGDDTDDARKWLSLDTQAWPADLDLLPANARGETVRFHLVVPRKEVSDRGDGKPAPVAILGHGYTGSRFDAVTLGGHMAKHGMATLSIDCVSHGIGLSESEAAQVGPLLGAFGLQSFGEALLKDRAIDQNADGTKDSGADFWTAYLFHTRDVVRQCALDYVQLIRILDRFDGEQKWAFDVNGDGDADLAGDFDGDGHVDIGGDAYITVLGASLGGIMSAVVAGVEPKVDATVPIAGGGGLGDIGARSLQGGVREAVILRMMGPLYVGDPIDEEITRIRTIVPDLNDDAKLDIGHTHDVEPGDTVLVDNLDNGERGCGYVDDAGRFRVAVESDVGDRTRLRFFEGDALVVGRDCELRDGATPRGKFDRLGVDVEFQGQTFERDQPLRAFAEGLALARATPRLRRFLALGQLVLDPGDPAIYARHMLQDPIEYPSTGEKTGAHAIVVTTMGDMNVPASSGVSLGRAAGLIPYTQGDPRYDNRPANQVLIDTFTAEAVHSYARFEMSDGQPTHMDIENFSQGTDPWRAEVPRLDPPLRLGFDEKDALGGYSAAIFPFAIPEGQHGFAFPGGMTDFARKECRPRCEAEGPCPCVDDGVFDVGNFMFNMFGRFLSSGGQHLETDACMSRDDCAWKKPPPEPR